MRSGLPRLMWAVGSVLYLCARRPAVGSYGSCSTTALVTCTPNSNGGARVRSSLCLLAPVALLALHIKATDTCDNGTGQLWSLRPRSWRPVDSPCQPRPPLRTSVHPSARFAHYRVRSRHAARWSGSWRARNASFKCPRLTWTSCGRRAQRCAPGRIGRRYARGVTPCRAARGALT